MSNIGQIWVINYSGLGDQVQRNTQREHEKTKQEQQKMKKSLEELGGTTVSGSDSAQVLASPLANSKNAQLASPISREEFEALRGKSDFHHQELQQLNASNNQVGEKVDNIEAQVNQPKKRKTSCQIM